MGAEQIIETIWKKYEEPSLRITIKATAKNNEEVLMNEYETLHSKLIVEWATKLFGDQDAVRIAAAAHDWDRAFPDIRVPFESSPEKYWDYKIAHAINSANIFYDNFKESINPQLMKDITYLIKRHEIGGRKNSDRKLLFTPDSYSNSYNIEDAAEKIQMADSISGFIAFLDKGPAIEARGDKYGLKKIGFYYGRAMPEAREIIDSQKITNPLLNRLFKEYKQKQSEITQDIDYQSIEDKFNKLDKK